MSSRDLTNFYISTECAIIIPEYIRTPLQKKIILLTNRTKLPQKQYQGNTKKLQIIEVYL